MRVHELIEALLKLPQNAAVVCDDAGGDVHAVESLPKTKWLQERTIYNGQAGPWRDVPKPGPGYEAAGWGHPEGCAVIRTINSPSKEER